MIKSKIDLQKAIMLNDPKWWNVNELTEIMRKQAPYHGLKSINHSTVERNFRHFREPKHGLHVEKRKVSDNTWDYRISHRSKPCTASAYAKSKGE